MDLSGMLGEGAGGDPYGIFTGSATASDPVGDRYIPPATAGGRPQTRPRPGFTGDEGGSPGGIMGGIDAVAQALRDKLSGRDEVGDEGGVQYSTVGELLKRFYSMDPDRRRRLQALLYAGGFFGEADVDQIHWGEADEESFSAWAQLIARTARMNAAGEETTFTDVLTEAATAAGIDLEVLGNLFGEGDEDDLEAYLDQATGQGDLVQLMLSDPNGLRQTIDRSASAVLGRRATPQEQQAFISMIHGIQTQGQLALQQYRGPFSGTLGGDLSGETDVSAELGYNDAFPAGGDTVVSYAAPDEAATADALLRQQNPGEAGAHDVALQVANFLELLNVPVDVPRITVGG